MIMNNKHEFCSGLDRKSGSESIVTQLDSVIFLFLLVFISRLSFVVVIDRMMMMIIDLLQYFFSKLLNNYIKCIQNEQTMFIIIIIICFSIDYRH
ncbi:hypothetical protein DERF_014899 [Dermatophagoides farinae]|uniref:Uncharacterized protein n=1 Tax=Dermatophagoides farinae TaxID=6954 RepID=A0A922KZP2_DERFA|nr:hypothetical protein DERF_014899 [Dermatophagoides farinae]